MTQKDIDQLAYSLGKDVTCIQTHISWVLLSGDRAYKVKKPVRYAFLDFSTLEKRRFYCHKEYALNRRFSPEIYLGVIPIYQKEVLWGIHGKPSEIRDYAVVMQRLSQEHQLDQMLKEDRFNLSDVQILARELAQIHKKCEVISTGSSAHLHGLDFADILKVSDVIDQYSGSPSGVWLKESVQYARKVIRSLEDRMEERVHLGFIRDGHGDLHCRNIFFQGKPILFDCLEFNDHLRQIDLLSELAFLGMDFYALGHAHIWPTFLEEYQKILPLILCPDDEKLMDWYLWYRANIRLKVVALRMMQSDDNQTNELIRYWKIYQHYAQQNGFGIFDKC